MATGDSNDILRRVKATIPFYWFAYVAPLRDAVLGGLSDAAAWCYSWIVNAQTQARLTTATGIFLDIISLDFLGRHLLRNGSADNIFRTKIRATILQERVTRQGMISALTMLTGYVPQIFEPWNARDTGAYNIGTLGYGLAGGWGSVQLPGQVFITVPIPETPGIPNTGGYSAQPLVYGSVALQGISEYAGVTLELGGLQNSDIYQTILTTKPTGVIAWTKIL